MPDRTRVSGGPAGTARRVIVIGNSDGIGRALTRALLARGDTVLGLSRSPLSDADVGGYNGAEAPYRHLVIDVTSADYCDRLAAACDELGEIDACIYCVGIGEPLALDQLGANRPQTSEHQGESAVFAVNLLGLVRTIEIVLPRMLAGGRGHIIGLSSQADSFPDSGAPSYGASKAGMSAYLERMALALRPRGIAITNVRFGFVDTKMAKADIRPFIISADRAAELVLDCLKRRPIRFTYPRRMALLLWFAGWLNRMRIWLG